jgi:hypothetical protein
MYREEAYQNGNQDSGWRFMGATTPAILIMLCNSLVFRSKIKRRLYPGKLPSSSSRSNLELLNYNKTIILLVKFLTIVKPLRPFYEVI